MELVAVGREAERQEEEPQALVDVQDLIRRAGDLVQGAAAALRAIVAVAGIEGWRIDDFILL